MTELYEVRVKCVYCCSWFFFIKEGVLGGRDREIKHTPIRDVGMKGSTKRTMKDYL